jgi:hypothetical protein
VKVYWRETSFSGLREIPANDFFAKVDLPKKPNQKYYSFPIELPPLKSRKIGTGSET